MLHTVNKSPFQTNALESCLRFANSGSGHKVLLFEDGVYAALKGTRFESLVKNSLTNVNIYVLVPDLEARGMRTENIIEGIKTAEYGDFVDLAADNKSVQAWL